MISQKEYLEYANKLANNNIICWVCKHSEEGNIESFDAMFEVCHPVVMFDDDNNSYSRRVRRPRLFFHKHCFNNVSGFLYAVDSK